MNIAIIGAGIGGLIAAILLKQQRFSVDIYERDNQPRTMGAGLILWPNATRLLSKAGLLQEVITDNFRLKKMETLDHQGQLLSILDIHDLEIEMSNYPAYPISRHQLQTSLLTIARKLGVNFYFDHHVMSILDNDFDSCIQFSNNKIISADLVIGADGRMKSIARDYVVGKCSPHYLGYVNWVGLLNHQGEMPVENIVQDYWGIGERFGIVPLSSSSFYWAGCKVLPAGLGEPKQGDKKKLIEIFQEWPELIQEIIEKTPDSSVNRIEVYDLDPISCWYRSNVVLLGDSAHAAAPTSGQGACQAIEDAFCLVECLSSKSSTELALKSYQNTRIPKTTKIIEMGRKLAYEIFDTDPKKCRIRNEKRKMLSGAEIIPKMAAMWAV